MAQNKIKTYREKMKLTATELSVKSGVSRAYISLLEKGIRDNPSHEVMSKIADSLGKSVQAVFFPKNKQKIQDISLEIDVIMKSKEDK